VRNPGGVAATAAALAGAAWNPGSARAVRRVAERLRPDVAHVHNTWFALSPAVLPALRRAGVPVVATLHNYRLLCANGQLFREGRPCEDCVGGNPWTGVRHRCYRDSAVLSVPAAATITLHARRGTWQRDVDLLLAPTAFARALLVRGGLPAERIRVKPNFVADPGPRTVPAARSRTLLYVGRLAEQKGVDVLLEAWVRRADPELELLVVGDGPLGEALERRGASGVRFEGRLPPDAVRARMLSARALVFPSRSYEVQPLVVLEALAAGLPVLASALGALPELLEPLGPAWTVADGTASAWASALGRLHDPQSVAKASAAARARYEASFTPTIALRNLLDAYEWARRPRTS
jgi:glycosyltransferase involved in cell wall biosynthesis